MVLTSEPCWGCCSSRSGGEPFDFDAGDPTSFHLVDGKGKVLMDDLFADGGESFSFRYQEAGHGRILIRLGNVQMQAAINLANSEHPIH